VFFFSSRRRHTRFSRDWSSDVCSSDLHGAEVHIVRWPLNQEAPFKFGEREGLVLHERKAFSTRALRRFAKELQPDIIIASGWVRSEERRVGKECRAGWWGYR